MPISLCKCTLFIIYPQKCDCDCGFKMYKILCVFVFVLKKIHINISLRLDSFVNRCVYEYVIDHTFSENTVLKV